MKLSINPPMDERLQVAQYKAGYYAFFTMFVLLLVLGFAWTIFPDYITTAVMYIALFFPGTTVFLIIMARSGWFEYMRDHNNSSPRNRRLSLVVLCLQTLFFATMMGLSHHYIPFGDRTPTVKESVLYAVLTGVFWGLGMGAFHVFRLRRKKIANEDD